MDAKKPRFAGQTVIVTGSSSGIGAATAKAFAAEGACVVLTAPAGELPVLQAMAEALRGLGQRCLVFAVDVTDVAQVNTMVEQVLQQCGRIDMRVNNAGVGYHGPFESMSLDAFDKVIRINLMGAVHCLYAVLPGMIERRAGQIVNIASAHSRRAHPRYAAYSASKYALRGLADSLRVELAPHGVGVLTYCPPYTESGFFEHVLHSVGRIKPQRAGATPEAVAAAIVDAAWRREREVIATPRERLLDFANRCMPSLVDFLIARRYASKLRNQL
ncbi:SDR family oxidoreductase [soil metagenome]